MIYAVAEKDNGACVSRMRFWRKLRGEIIKFAKSLIRTEKEIEITLNKNILLLEENSDKEKDDTLFVKLQPNKEKLEQQEKRVNKMRGNMVRSRALHEKDREKQKPFS